MRTAAEIYADHSAKFGTGDLAGVLANYAEDALFITPNQVLHGPSGVRQGLEKLLADLPDAQWEIKEQIASDVILLSWTANNGTVQVLDGTDTFVIRDGKIHAQTVSYTVVPA